MPPKKGTPEYNTWIEKLRRAQREIWKNPERLEKHRRALAGRSELCPPENRRRMSEERRGKNNPMFGKPSPKRGKTVSEETKKKIAAKVTGRKRPLSERKRISETLKKRLAELTYEERLERTRPALESLRNLSTSTLESIVQFVLDELSVSYVAQKQLGPFVVDFYFPQWKLVLEVDGDYWHSLPEQQERDRRKDQWLQKNGYRIIRLTESEIREDARRSVEKIFEDGP